MYHVRLQGRLDEDWSDTLAGMKVIVTPDHEGYPVTTLSGRIVDQAMLLGVLNCVYDLGLPLLFVQLIAVEEGEIHEHHER